MEKIVEPSTILDEVVWYKLLCFGVFGIIEKLDIMPMSSLQTLNNLMQMSLEKELNPVKADDLHHVLAVSDMNLLAGVEECEKELQTTVTENDRFHDLQASTCQNFAMVLVRDTF